MYNVIYADPPWQFRVWNKDTGQGRSAESHYPTMELDDLKRINIQSLCNDDCALFMWATYPTLPEALALGTAWGFEYKTCAFTWVKRTKYNDAWFMGMGYWTRSNAEPCLLFTKGTPKRVSKSVRQLIIDESIGGLFEPIIQPIGRHSEKPVEAYRRIEKLMGNVPKLELFARQTRKGWDSLGNEIDGNDILDLNNSLKD